MLSSLYRMADLARHHGRSRKWEADQATGRRGEDIAHRFLQRAGMVVVARNHRTAGGSGEIDLIAWDGETLVFVEVKTRSTGDYGPPDRAIDTEKERRILYAARDYTRRANIPWERVRFDTVSIVLNVPPYVAHQRDVFTMSSSAAS
jgi:putative endonuclease